MRSPYNINRFRSLNIPQVDPDRIKYLWSRLRQAVKSYIVFKRMGSDIKMYGANETIEIQKEDLPPGLIIYPNSHIKKNWNLFILILIIINSIFLPYNICFYTSSYHWRYLKLIEDFAFIIDIVLSLFSGYYYHDHTLITTKEQIFRNYLKSWLIIDCISAIPFQFLSEEYVLLTLLSLSKFFKLLSSSMKLPNWLSFSSNQSVERLFQIFGAIMILVQIFACLWYLIARVNQFSEETWIGAKNLQDKSDFYIYLTSIYWVLVTITTVGFGDVVPVNTQEKIFTMIVMGFGVGLYSLTVGNLTTLIAGLDQKQRLMNSKLQTLQEIAVEAKIPEELKEKLKQTVIQNSNENLSVYNESNIISELPSSLRSEVSLYLHKAIIEKIKFFHLKSPSFLAFVVPKLKHMACAEHEYLYHADDDAYESNKYIVYFIKQGRVLLKASNGVVFRAYPLGSYLGEIELIENTKRQNTAQISANPAEMLTLSKKNLELIFSEYPEVGIELIEIANTRQKVNSESMLHVLTLNPPSESHIDDSLHSESHSEPEEEQPSSKKRITFLLRRDTGVMVSDLTISPTKVKNITKWSRAVKEAGRSKTLAENEYGLMLEQRKKSMKREASIKIRNNQRFKLEKLGKGMKLKEVKRKIVEISDESVEFEEACVVEEKKDTLEDMEIKGLLHEVAQIDGSMINHAIKSLDVIGKIEDAQFDILEDLLKLEDYITILS